MTRILYVLPFVIFSVTVSIAQHRVEVVITGIRDTTGVVMVGLFKDEKSFLKKPVVGVVVKATNGWAHVVFEGQPTGEYAVSIIHDSDRNGKLDKNFLGIPREGFGFSNNAMGVFGPPSFEKAKFTVKSPTRVYIMARYL